MFMLQLYLDIKRYTEILSPVWMHDCQEDREQKELWSAADDICRAFVLSRLSITTWWMPRGMWAATSHHALQSFILVANW